MTGDWPARRRTPSSASPACLPLRSCARHDATIGAHGREPAIPRSDHRIQGPADESGRLHPRRPDGGVRLEAIDGPADSKLVGVLPLCSQCGDLRRRLRRRWRRLVQQGFVFRAHQSGARASMGVPGRRSARPTVLATAFAPAKRRRFRWQRPGWSGQAERVAAWGARGGNRWNHRQRPRRLRRRRRRFEPGRNGWERTTHVDDPDLRERRQQPRAFTVRGHGRDGRRGPQRRHRRLPLRRLSGWSADPGNEQAVPVGHSDRPNHWQRKHQDPRHQDRGGLRQSERPVGGGPIDFRRAPRRSLRVDPVGSRRRLAKRIWR